MSAADLKALARNLNHAAWMAGSLDSDESWVKSDRAALKRAETFHAMLDAIDAAFPSLPAAQTITLGVEPLDGMLVLDLEQLP